MNILFYIGRKKAVNKSEGKWKFLGDEGDTSSIYSDALQNKGQSCQYKERKSCHFLFDGGETRRIISTHSELEYQKKAREKAISRKKIILKKKSKFENIHIRIP